MSDPLRDALPCPFCGECKLTVCKTSYLDTHAFAVSCLMPECHGAIYSLGYGHFPTEAKAIAAWNTRTPRIVSEEMVAARMVELYQMDALRVAAICDEQLDRTGNLLGYVRQAALAATEPSK